MLGCCFWERELSLVAASRSHPLAVVLGLSCLLACGIVLGRGIEPMSPELAGGFLITRPPGKPQNNLKNILGTSLVAQWLGLHAPNVGALGLIPGWGTRSYMPQLRPDAAK